jgi:isoleucyl-tRNA synthetase
VEYVHDMSIGPTVLGQCAEALRRIRNSARFILGNIGPGLDENEIVGREHLGLVSGDSHIF